MLTQVVAQEQVHQQQVLAFQAAEAWQLWEQAITAQPTQAAEQVAA